MNLTGPTARTSLIDEAERAARLHAPLITELDELQSALTASVSTDTNQPLASDGDQERRGDCCFSAMQLCRCTGSSVRSVLSRTNLSSGRHEASEPGGGSLYGCGRFLPWL